MRDVHHHQAQDIEAATAVLERYVHPDTLDPVLVVGLDSLIDDAMAASAAVGRPIRRTRAARLVAERFIDLRLNVDTRIDSFSLDVDPDVPGRPTLYGHIEQPQICFVSLPEGSRLAVKHGVEAAAFYYKPDPAVTRRTDRGQVRCSDFVHSGYLGFVRMFVTEDEAYTAAAELKQAITTLAAPVDDSNRDDPVRYAHGSAEEDFDVTPF